MKLNELEIRMDQAYKELLGASYTYRNEAEETRQREYNLKTAILDAYAHSRIEGKNATERDAAERSIFGVELDELENQKQNESVAFRDKEQAEIEVKYLHDVLRIKELSNVE